MATANDGSPSRFQKRYTAEADYSSDCFSLEQDTSFIVPADHAEAKPAGLVSFL
jgi:hypothetical protein